MAIRIRTVCGILLAYTLSSLLERLVPGGFSFFLFRFFFRVYLDAELSAVALYSYHVYSIQSLRSSHVFKSLLISSSMRSSGLVVFISANFLPHIIAIPNNSPPGTELIQDPAWGDNSWNINSDNLQEGLSASVSSVRSYQITRRLMLLNSWPVTPMDMTWLLQTANPRSPRPSQWIQASLILQQPRMIARIIRSQSDLEDEPNGWREILRSRKCVRSKLSPPTCSLQASRQRATPSPKSNLPGALSKSPRPGSW